MLSKLSTTYAWMSSASRGSYFREMGICHHHSSPWYASTLLTPEIIKVKAGTVLLAS